MGRIIGGVLIVEGRKKGERRLCIPGEEVVDLREMEEAMEELS